MYLSQFMVFFLNVLSFLGPGNHEILLVPDFATDEQCCLRRASGQNIITAALIENSC
jgi:hypothetical protein